MRHWWNYLVETIERPRDELSRRQHQLRTAWDLVIHCGEQLRRHRAEGMAAELTYRTIFSLIPVVVLGLVMFRVFGGLDDVQLRVENQLYSFFGVPQIPAEYIPVPEPDPGALPTELTVNASEVNTPDFRDPEDAVIETVVDAEREDADRPADAAMKAGGLGAGGMGSGGLGSEAEGQLQGNVTVPAIDGYPPTAEDAAGEVVDAKELVDQAEADNQAREIIRRTLHGATSKIASLDFASIGVFGLLLFIYAAVALADATEYLFNRIFDAPTQRPIHLRVAVHWSIITLGSGLLALSLYMSAQVIDWFGDLGAGSGPVWILQHALSLLAAWVLLFLLYALMPNTHVSVRAAVMGSAVSAVLWEFAKYGFQIYVTTAVPYLELYGSIGVIPLFLLWIYLTWLIVLFGLILTYTLQTVRGKEFRRRSEKQEDLPAGDPDWMLPIMTEVAIAFAGGEAVGRQELSDRLGLSSRVVHEMETRLIEGNFLRRVVTGPGQENQLTLARPAKKILLAEVMRLAHRFRPASNHPAWKTLADLKEAECVAAGSRSLAEWMGGDSPASEGDSAADSAVSEPGDDGNLSG
ncbi:YihY/virulence factor BrkB family protein [Rhodopirellula sp. P2]|uniref:YihY/virulence factor BrkB family protein n=1 Tax=Rhodopirellula sp. P2 TaxID=2127060 RepID=UPI002368D445|nr:YihY/virulence factor BrkB family protein [Rhodopirellula sp. P2]WDQ19024.1 YihY/virulence factor BrkB family protein [Rhodopirellula sp. P2]